MCKSKRSYYRVPHRTTPLYEPHLFEPPHPCSQLVDLCVQVKGRPRLHVYLDLVVPIAVRPAKERLPRCCVSPAAAAELAAAAGVAAARVAAAGVAVAVPAGESRTHRCAGREVK